MCHTLVLGKTGTFGSDQPWTDRCTWCSFIMSITTATTYPDDLPNMLQGPSGRAYLSMPDWATRAANLEPACVRHASLSLSLPLSSS